MLKKGVRGAITVIVCIFAIRFLMGTILARLLIVLAAVMIGIFALARFGSRKQENTGTGKKTAETKQASKAQETGKTEQSSPASDEPQSMNGHIRAAAKSLHNICCMDIRNLGLNVLKTAKNILKENEEGNTCQGFSQFENYYLPTFRKTVENYSMMEGKGVTTLKHREDMLAYLKSCDEAFSRIYSSMFDDDIMDMKVQMEAMNLTFRRDGLL